MVGICGRLPWQRQLSPIDLAGRYEVYGASRRVRCQGCSRGFNAVRNWALGVCCGAWTTMSDVRWVNRSRSQARDTNPI